MLSRAPDIDSDSGPRRIAVLRALQLGDFLCVVPALRALRVGMPHARITLIGLPWAACLAPRFHRYIDDFIALPGIPGLPEQAVDEAALAEFIAAARQRQFDLALQLHGSGAITNALLLQLGAASNAGFFPAAGDCPDPSRFLPWREDEHEVLRALRLLRHLGIASRGDALEFPVGDNDYQALRQCRPGLPPPGTYACIHPGARMPTRRWPPQRFAAVADQLAAQGLSIVLTGAAEEAGLTQTVAHTMRAPAIDLTGKTGLGALAALIGQARIVVCNDTGVSHLAAALAIPSVVVCSGADARRWAPLNGTLHRTLYHPVVCRPCMHDSCPIGHPCALGVTVESVLQQAFDLLPVRQAGVANRSLTA